MKTVRGNTSRLNAFRFEVQYVSCSDACKHACYVVDEVIAPNKGSNPSTPSYCSCKVYSYRLHT